MELRILFERVEERVAAIRAGAADWPCRAGCDFCCRHLARAPEVTGVEWAILEPRLTAEMRAGILALRGAERPVICPMLDRRTGECRVYDVRPVACRTYGFYVERGVGLHCGEIEGRDNSGVVWGNADSISAALRDAGPPRSIVEWVSED